MIRIPSEKELLESFRLIDRDEVEVPKDLRFPIVVKDYLAWSEPSGYRTYLVFGDGERRQPLGIVFRRDQLAGGASPQMCEWCHCVRGSDGVSMLSATASSKRRIGI